MMYKTLHRKLKIEQDESRTLMHVIENWLQLLMINCFNEWLVIVRWKTNLIFVYSWQQITHIAILCRIFYLLFIVCKLLINYSWYIAHLPLNNHSINQIIRYITTPLKMNTNYLNKIQVISLNGKRYCCPTLYIANHFSHISRFSYQLFYKKW